MLKNSPLDPIAASIRCVFTPSKTSFNVTVMVDSSFESKLTVDDDGLSTKKVIN